MARECTVNTSVTCLNLTAAVVGHQPELDTTFTLEISNPDDWLLYCSMCSYLAIILVDTFFPFFFFKIWKYPKPHPRDTRMDNILKSEKLTNGQNRFSETS